MTDATLQAALESESPFLFGAVKISFPDAVTLRLLDGSGILEIGGETYVGEDATFGTLDSIGVHTESMDDEAPELEISLLPADDAVAADLASSAMQGSEVQVMLGAFNPVTGSVLGTPEQIFLGEIDVPTIEVTKGRRLVSYTVVSVFERLFEINQGERASDGWHQSIWPGELGLEFMTGTVKNLYWGAKKPVQSTYGNQGTYVPGYGYIPAIPVP